MKSSSRFCAYCLKPQCRCTYRTGRRGKSFRTGYNTSAQTTMGEMRKEFAEALGAIPDGAAGIWSFSFTDLDLAALNKAIAKADKL